MPPPLTRARLHSPKLAATAKVYVGVLLSPDSCGVMIMTNMMMMIMMMMAAHMCAFCSTNITTCHFWILTSRNGYWNSSDSQIPYKKYLMISDVHDNLTKRRNTPTDSIQNKTRWFSSGVGIRRHLIYLAKFWSRNVSSLWEDLPCLYTTFSWGKIIHDQGLLFKKNEEKHILEILRSTQRDSAAKKT